MAKTAKPNKLQDAAIHNSKQIVLPRKQTTVEYRVAEDLRSVIREGSKALSSPLFQIAKSLRLRSLWSHSALLSFFLTLSVVLNVMLAKRVHELSALNALLQLKN